MNNLNYDVLSNVLNFLSQNECYNFAISSKIINSILRNRGFLKTVSVNEFYPRKKEETPYILMQRMYMHINRVENLNVNYIENPISWMPSQWPKNVKFVSCSFDGNIIDPKKKVITENLYISGRYSSKVKINMEKFPNLKELILL
jgi:hypothetical protein